MGFLGGPVNTIELLCLPLKAEVELVGLGEAEQAGLLGGGSHWERVSGGLGLMSTSEPREVLCWVGHGVGGSTERTSPASALKDVPISTSLGKGEDSRTPT